MAGTFKFELVSPERVLMDTDAESVVAPGAEGQFAILAGHAPFVSTLVPGIVQVTSGGKTTSIFAKGGFAEATPESLTILAEHAFVVSDAGRDRVREELAAAEKGLAEATDDETRWLMDCAVRELRALQ